MHWKLRAYVTMQAYENDAWSLVMYQDDNYSQYFRCLGVQVFQSITDSTAVNTGIDQGLIVRLKNEIAVMGQPEPQFIACQHHILDLTFRHVLNDPMRTPTTKPQMNLPFIDELQARTNSFKFLTLPKKKRWRSRIILDVDQILNSCTNSAKHTRNTKRQMCFLN